MAGKWKWPSGMHNFAQGKANMKDMGILLLVVMQRVFHDKTTFYPVAAGSALAHSITVLLIFLVANEYWGAGVGLLMAALYASSLWPYMIILQGALQGLALMFLLLAVMFLQLGDAREFSLSVGWVAASGVAFAAMMFSSASSRKFIPLYLAAFIFSQSDAVEILRNGPWKPESEFEWAVLFTGSLISVALIIQVVICNIIAPAGHHGADQKSGIKNIPILGSPIGKLIGVYRKVTKKTTATLFGTALTGSIGLTLVVLWFGSPSFQIAMIFGATGFFGLILLLVYPEIIANIRGYYETWTAPAHSGHYRHYDEYFQQRVGKPLREGVGGLRWYIKHHWRLAPFHFVFFGASVGYLGYSTASNGFDIVGAPVVAVVLLGLSPMFWGEATKGPKAALPNFPSFGAVFLVLGYATFLASQSLSSDEKTWFWIAAWSAAALGSFWNLWAILTDVWPAKMGITRLEQRLAKLRATALSTYKGRHNESFLDALPEEVLKQYQVQHITKLSEVSERYVVIPPINSKAPSFQSSTVGYSNDNELDPMLSELVDSKKIVHCAVGQYRTYGSSRYWPQIADVSSYRELILREVTDHDRWRGLGWILDARKLKTAINWAGDDQDSRSNE